ncbi:MAG: hypothetical protein AB8H79_22775 [Myxococcota bacterium]
MNKAQRVTHRVVWLIMAPALVGFVLWGIFAGPDLVQPDPPASAVTP